ncbi:MAG: sulfatase-like hydrolase/transferase [Bacteroidaceae bacterium]|nr:sulfatase-like hydrolase/transferase [Bacteroidaceae bacterium]
MTCSRRYTLAAAFVAAASLQARPAGDDRPDIILFMVDDMGWQDTSVPFWTQRTPLNERYETPNMERLASRGMLFTQAYASSISSPSRCSLLTGTNAARHRVTNWTFRCGQMTDGEDGRRTLIWNYPHVWGNTGPGIDNNCAIHQGDWKLIYYYKTGRKELFDIRSDIGEQHDLSAGRPDLVRALSRELGRRLRKMRAQRPVYKATGQSCPWPDE